MYLTWKGRILTFTQPKFPEAGRQVIAGTMEPGESPEVAALRELKEECGITQATVVRVLGEFLYSMQKFKRAEIQQRYVVHLQVSDEADLKEDWAYFEEYPSSGGEPIEFSFQWSELDNSEPLIGGHDFFLPMLRHFVQEHSEE